MPLTSGWRCIWKKILSEWIAREAKHSWPPTDRTLTTQFAYNGDGVGTSKTIDETTNDYVLDLAATLPVVISDTDAIYLYGLDIIAQQRAERYYRPLRRAPVRPYDSVVVCDFSLGFLSGPHPPCVAGFQSLGGG